MAVNPFIDRDDILAKIRAAFTARDAQYAARRAELKKRLAPLAARLEQLQGSEHPMNCADQIRLEVQWLLNYREDSMHCKGICRARASRGLSSCSN